jgi:hypothetical protein
MEYTWKLTKLKRANISTAENVIVQTYWELTGTDEDGDTGVFSGATPFDVNNIDPDSLTPYAELTEQDVLSWIQAVVVGGYKEHVEGQIIRQIQAKKSVLAEDSETDFPWAPSEE